MTKNEQIAQTMRATYEKRRHQRCRVFELKVRKHRLNKEQSLVLDMMFVEAKWCYNYLVAGMRDESVDIFSYKSKNLVDITHKDKDGNDVPVRIAFLTSSLKDALVERMRSQIKTLATLKRRKRRVGNLRFVSECSSIPLKQNGITHKILSSNRIRIQGIKKPLPVSGLDQMSRYGDTYDIANAVLRKKGGDYYINLTVYFDREEFKEHDNHIIGIDLGCETSLTLSDGRKINCVVEETERLKRLVRRRQKKQKNSNGYRRLTDRIRKEYDRITHIKDDAANKIVHGLLEQNDIIVMQDEQVHSWHKKHGKKVQHGILGRVKTRLAEHHDQVVVINRFVPTSRFCPECGHVHKDLRLWDRTFVCPSCGSTSDRDVHAAKNMVWFFENMNEYIGADGSEFKRAEFDEEALRVIRGWDSRTLKHEDANSLG